MPTSILGAEVEDNNIINQFLLNALLCVMDWFNWFICITYFTHKTLDSTMILKLVTKIQFYDDYQVKKKRPLKGEAQRIQCALK